MDGGGEGGGGSKRLLSWFLRRLREHPDYGPSAARGLVDSIEQLVAKTLIAIQPSLAHTYRNCFAHQQVQIHHNHTLPGQDSGRSGEGPD
jgi:hypothetical protein